MGSDGGRRLVLVAMIFAAAMTFIDYALSLRTVYYVLAAVMAVSFVVAALTLPGGHSSADDAMPAGG